MKSATGGPAFSRPASSDGDRSVDAQDGMSIRDYFAAKALQGMTANESVWNLDDTAVDASINMIAREAYRLADAMISERKSK